MKMSELPLVLRLIFENLAMILIIIVVRLSFAFYEILRFYLDCFFDFFDEISTK